MLSVLMLHMAQLQFLRNEKKRCAPNEHSESHKIFIDICIVILCEIQCAAISIIYIYLPLTAIVAKYQEGCRVYVVDKSKQFHGKC